MRQETKDIEVEVEARDAKLSTPKREHKFSRNTSPKIGFVEERGFKKLVSPFKEEVKKRSWETVSRDMEAG